MNHETFFENFELLAEAPNGVEKLREIILQLAFQGKLVRQDPNDEPPPVIIDRLRGKKEKLVKENRIKNSGSISLINPEDLDNKLPSTWVYVKLSEIINFQRGKKPKTLIEIPEKYPYINIAAFEKGEISYFSDNKENENLTFCDENNLLIVCDGSRSGLVGFGRSGILGSTLAKIDYFDLFEKLYLFYFLKSKYSVFNNNKKGAAIPHLDINLFKNLMFPIPSRTEQKRIVAKVDQLMALCDQLEARQQKKHEQRILLNNAALDKLLTAPTPEEFAQHWQRICDNFDLLYDAPETVGEFRKAILQLAVQGKLVRQDANDEPAAVLLEKIRAEKERLVKEGKIRKQKAVPPVEGSDGLFELPESWQWDRFANVTLSSEAGWSPQCEKREREGNEWGVLKVSAVSWNVFKPHENKALPSSLEPRSQHEVKVGDFLLSRANTLELVAKSVVVEDSPPKLMMSDKLIRLHLSENVERRFFNIFNNCSTARGYYAKEASGTSSSMRNVSRECILKMPVPVPPLQEQRRIVAKVDQLIPLCDELEAGLVQAQTEGGRLMEAVVHHVLAG